LVYIAHEKTLLLFGGVLFFYDTNCSKHGITCCVAIHSSADYAFSNDDLKNQTDFISSISGMFLKKSMQVKI